MQAERPDWRDETLGTMVRIALWLLAEVGEGETFTKADLRAAFPNREQVDRRMRDLRPHRWQILTNRQDCTLSPNELRFAGAGAPVWDGSVLSSPSQLPNRRRAEILARDGYLCLVCGITSGEAYPDAPELTATLTVTGETDDDLFTVCGRCKAGRRPSTRVADVVPLVESLDREDLETLTTWLAKGRAASGLERAWALVHQLPEPQRTEVVRLVERLS